MSTKQVKGIYTEENDGSKMSEVRCQFCGCELKDNVVLCEKCSTPHHKDCFQCNGICTTYACGSKAFVNTEAGAVNQPSEAHLCTLPQETESDAISLVTPEYAQINHSYHGELSRHTFSYCKLGVCTTTVLRYMPIAMMLGMFIFPWSKIMSLIVILLFYLFSREEKKYEAKLFGELTIDQDYIKFLHHLESPDGKEKDPETLLTVRREDIEGINLDFTQEGELTGFFINVIAKGKVRSAESGADKVHFLDTMEVATFMAKDEAKWLFDCVEHLATVKKVA